MRGIIATGLAGLMLLTGCATLTDAARKGLDVSAKGVNAADTVFAPLYTAKAKEALKKAANLVEYKQAMKEWDAVLMALLEAKQILHSAEQYLKLWETDSSKSAPFIKTARRLYVALYHLKDMLAMVGIEVPQELEDAYRLGKSLLGV